MKTKKALAKRVKVSGNKKILKRPNRQNHFNAKDSGNAGRRKKGLMRAPDELRDLSKVLLSQY